MKRDLLYVATTKKTVDQAVIDILKAIDKKGGWSLFQVIDLHERLVAKGFSQEPLKIIELCSGKHADALLKENKNTSVCMPCRISVYSEQGKTRIVAIRPSMMTDAFPNVKKLDLECVELDIENIIDMAK